MLTTLTLLCGWILCIFVGLLAAVILWLILHGDIDLTRLISEPNGDASLSRLQFLVFTFVIALSLFLIIAAGSPPHFPDIPGTVLTLLGISGSSYLVSKGIQFSDPAGVVEKGANDVVIEPSQAVVRYGQSRQFGATVPRKPGSSVKWAVIAGGGSIDASGLYTAPAQTVPPSGVQHATIQVTSDAYPDAHDLAVVTLS
ncbi:MAG TPA: hypothetical protein VKB58_10240 [Terriglobales bacterium]|jgi:hypothetical protein|nr:hypothetical protein [Terriglobales bacterium]